ncbi:hypothetical protein CJD36_015330 [Flavipsychrobacter stenotrophus]|uniref:histidine kinase n=1 Tax=Flavipsychrobacter stenotrophus TaxID=2077091 RepID=A0A2S7ST11_9BACT|nr:PAS domain S-box protein [Flavipsychrobacter stenotrophus]PQJ10069.1 hypothetical protein CJD36_015330 [Flavipsychrobacter stenotrophus]
MKKILLVDDKPELLQSGRATFEAGGYEVETASNGAEALTLIMHHQIDLVITDVVMPVMNGYSLCYAIRTGVHQNDVPVVIYSASFIKPRHRELGLEVGANIFIPKQSNSDYLLQAASRIFSTEGTGKWIVNERLSAAEVLKKYETLLIMKMESKSELFSLTEVELMKNEERFRALVEHSNDLISMIDEKGTVIYHSPAARRLLGYEGNEALGMQALDFFHPDDQAEVIARLQVSLGRPGEPIFRSNRMRHKDGHYIWTEGSTTNLLHDPSVKAFVGNFREITERMVAASKLEQNEKRIEAERKKFADLFEQAPSYICTLSGPDLVYEMANPLYLQITGKRDIIGKKAKEVFPELEAQGFVDLIFNVYHTGVPFAASEVPITIKNDETGLMTEHYMNFVYQPYKGDDGNVAGVFFFANLVTDLVKAREEMSVKERRFRALVENGSDAVVILDGNGAPIYLSPSVEKLLGYIEEEAKTLDLFAITHPDDIEEVRSGMLEVFANPGVVFDGRISRLKHKNGTWRWYEATLTNMLHDPLINGIVDNFRDITDRKIAEEKIEHANRLYSFLSHINQAIVHVDNQTSLFKEACRIAHTIGKFKMAWVGLLDSENKTVDITEGMGVLPEDVHLFTNIKYRPEGGIAQVVRSKTAFVCNHMEEHPTMKVWASYVAKREIRALMILPLRRNGEIIAVFNLYANEADFFDEQEIDLLEEVANDISFAIDVFEKERLRKHMELRVLHNELRLKQAQAIAHIGSWDYDFSIGKVIWSEEACRIYGIDPGKNELDEGDWQFFCHPDDLQDMRKVIEKAQLSLTDFAHSHRIILADGTIKHIFSESHFEFDNTGNLTDIHGIIHDVTAKKEAEEKILNANRLYAFISQVNQTIVQVTNEEVLFKAVCDIAIEQGQFDLAWISMPDQEKRTLNVVAHCNATASDISLLNSIKFSDDGPIAQVMNTGKLFVINDFITDEVAADFRAYASSRGFRSCIVLPIRKGGKTIGAYNLISAKANLFDAEEISLLTEATNDVSFALDIFEKEKHRSEMAEIILQSEASLKHAQAMAHFGSWELDFATGKAIWSEEACRIYGIPVEDRHNQNFESWKAHLHPDDMEQVLAMVKESEINLSRTALNHKIITTDGVVRHVFSEAHYNFDRNGLPVGLRGVVHDITEARAAEESLARSEENLRLIMDIIPQSICLKNYGGKYIFVNKSYAELYDSIPEDIIGKYMAEVMSAENDIERITNENKQIISSGEMLTIPGEEFYDDSGKLKLFHTMKVPFTVAGTNEKALLSVSLDITEQKAEEAEKAKIISDIVQRNKDLEQFSYIVSHNLRAPVANIIGLADVLVDDSLETDVRDSLMTDLSGSVKKLDSVIMDINYILQVKHTDSNQKEHVNLSAILSDIKLSVDNLIRSNDVQIITDFSAVDELFTLKSYLYSIIYNLVSNSIKYRRVNVAPVLHIASKMQGNKIALIFEDNGLGIDLLKRKDEMFGLYKRFHTHVNGKGMGLFMVKTQVESLGGTISVVSEVNKGTTFTIELDGGGA